MALNGQCRGCSDANKRAWLAKYPDRGKRYGSEHYAANADAYKKRAAAWRKANPEKASASGKKTRSRPGDAERRLAAERARRAQNPESSRVRVRNRRARVKKAPGSHTAADIAAIATAQRHRCAYCPATIKPKTWEVDHITPIAKGGGNGPSNLQLLCRPCNRSKSAKDPLVFAREKGLLL